MISVLFGYRLVMLTYVSFSYLVLRVPKDVQWGQGLVTAEKKQSWHLLFFLRLQIFIKFQCRIKIIVLIENVFSSTQLKARMGGVCRQIKSYFSLVSVELILPCLVFKYTKFKWVDSSSVSLNNCMMFISVFNQKINSEKG